MQVVSWPHLLQSTSNRRNSTGGSSCDGSRLASGEREGDGSDEGDKVDLDLVGGGDCQEAGQQGAASIGGEQQPHNSRVRERKLKCLFKGSDDLKPEVQALDQTRQSQILQGFLREWRRG